MREITTLQNLSHIVSTHIPIIHVEEIQNKRNYQVFPSYLIYNSKKDIFNMADPLA